jgi:hypothetical protein
MSKPGPKPGWKQRRALMESQADGASAPLLEPVQASVQEAPTSAHARENPAMLQGDALKALAYRKGLAKSDLAHMTDEKIREQLKYATYRQYEDELV